MPSKEDPGDGILFTKNTMTYLFKDKDGKEIELTPERWAWGVVYDDGTQLKQFGDDGRFHQIGEVDQERIEMAVLYQPANGAKRIDIPWRKGMKLIHKYRNVVMNVGQKDERHIRIHVFGYKEGAPYYGRSFMFVLPDDRIVWSSTDEIDVLKFNP
jgi:hypothetical protein